MLGFPKSLIGKDVIDLCRMIDEMEVFLFAQKVVIKAVEVG
jgi:hypothetical protein